MDLRSRLPGSTGARKQMITQRGAVLIGVFVVAVIMLGLPLREFLHQRTEIADAQAEQAAAKGRVDDLQHQVDLWSSDEYVVQKARERLHWVLPGEVGYQVILPGAENNPVIQPPLEQPTELVGPWYGRLWTSMRVADRDAQKEASSSFPITPR